MNDLTTTNAERRLLAEISRWRKASGWSDSTRGWINEQNIGDAAVAVKPDPDATDTFRVTWRKGNGGWHQPISYSAVDVQQAVDFLVALNILPAGFSSAYKAGWDDCATLTNAHFDELKLASQDGLR